MRPTGIELVSSAPQADTLSIELWARKSFLAQMLLFDYLLSISFLKKECKFITLTSYFLSSLYHSEGGLANNLLYDKRT